MASKDEKIQKALGTLRTYRVRASKGAATIAHLFIQAKNEDRAIAKVKAVLLAGNKSILGLSWQAQRVDE